MTATTADTQAITQAILQAAQSVAASNTPSQSIYVDAGTYSSLLAADAAASAANKTLIISKNYALTQNTTLTSALLIFKGGGFTKASTYTLTINGPFSTAGGLYQVFTGFSAGDVTFGPGSVGEINPEWWKVDGSNDPVAIQSAVNAGNTGGGFGYLVRLRGSFYNLGSTTVTGRNNIAVVGNGKRATILNYTGTGVAVAYDNLVNTALKALRISVGTNTNTIALRIVANAVTVVNNIFDELELAGNGAAGQIGIYATASGGFFLSENFFRKITISGIDKPVVRAGTEGNFWEFDIANFGNGASPIAINSNSLSERTEARVAGVNGGVTSPTAYVETGNLNITTLHVDIGASPASAINVAASNIVILARAAHVTPIGSFAPGVTVIDDQRFYIQGYAIVYGTAAPVSGTWGVGDRFINSTPVVGQPKSWVCTVAGAPGTWVSEGNL